MGGRPSPRSPIIPASSFFSLPPPPPPPSLPPPPSRLVPLNSSEGGRPPNTSRSPPPPLPPWSSQFFWGESTSQRLPTCSSFPNSLPIAILLGDVGLPPPPNFLLLLYLTPSITSFGEGRPPTAAETPSFPLPNSHYHFFWRRSASHRIPTSSSSPT